MENSKTVTKKWFMNDREAQEYLSGLKDPADGISRTVNINNEEDGGWSVEVVEEPTNPISEAFSPEAIYASIAKYKPWPPPKDQGKEALEKYLGSPRKWTWVSPDTGLPIEPAPRPPPERVKKPRGEYRKDRERRKKLNPRKPVAMIWKVIGAAATLASVSTAGWKIYEYLQAQDIEFLQTIEERVMRSDEDPLFPIGGEELKRIMERSDQ